MKCHQQLPAEHGQSRECRRKLPKHPLSRRDSDLCAAPHVFFSALSRPVFALLIGAQFKYETECLGGVAGFAIRSDPEQGRVALVQWDLSRRAPRYMKNCSDTIFPSLTS